MFDIDEQLNNTRLANGHFAKSNVDSEEEMSTARTASNDISFFINARNAQSEYSFIGSAQQDMEGVKVATKAPAAEDEVMHNPVPEIETPQDVEPPKVETCT